ncbi:hypothetical protein ES703_117373 [subsurface metagenome]
MDVKRKPWDEFFFGIAKMVSNQSTCLRRQYGAVLVRDKTIISTGFNGAPRGCPHCIDIGCAREDYASGEHHELCRATHAEQNTIANAARMGVCVMDSELYLSPPDLPCPLCAKILINAGVKAIHYKNTDYPGWEMSQKFFEEAGVELRR